MTPLSNKNVEILKCDLSSACIAQIASHDRDTIARDIVIFCRQLMQGKDRVFYRHSQNVVLVSSRMANLLGLEAEQKGILRTGAILHDIGKIFIDNAVLRKRGPFNEADIKIMREHPRIGYNMIKSFGEYLSQEVLDIILHHHERNDGCGYPERIRELSLLVEICAVSDMAVGMQEFRYCRRGKTVDESIAEILRYRWSENIELILKESQDVFVLDDDLKLLVKKEEA